MIYDRTISLADESHVFSCPVNERITLPHHIYLVIVFRVSVCVRESSGKRYIPLILENFHPNIKTQRIWPKHLHHPFLLALSVMIMMAVELDLILLRALADGPYRPYIHKTHIPSCGSAYDMCDTLPVPLP